MSAIDDLFAAAQRVGVGVLVINNLQIGDVVNAAQVIGGDYNDSHNVTITNPRPQESRRMLTAHAFGDSKACVPLAEELHGHASYDWREEYFNQQRKSYVDGLRSAGMDVTG